MKKIFNFIKVFVKQNSLNSSGFTLVELLVAIGLFSVIVAIAVGGFAKALQAQRQVLALLSANGNVSLALEEIGREVRTGRWFCHVPTARDAVDTQSDCSPPSDTAGNYSAINTLAFFNSLGKEVAYCAAAGALRKNDNVVSGQPVCDSSTPPLTSSDVNVDYLSFKLHGNQSNDGYPPRITVTIGVNAKEVGVSSGLIKLETTISARRPDS